MRKKNGKYVKCKFCKKLFYVTPHRIIDGRGKYCSKPCFNEAEKYFPQYKRVRDLAAKARKGLKESKEIKEKKRIARRAYLSQFIGKRVNSSKGYVLVYDPNHFTHEYANYVQEHRYVIEKILNRPLKTNEEVHHVNKNKRDNRIKNLVVLNSASAHKRMDWGSKVYKKEIVFDGRKYKV